jgi:hypothetical protein
MNPTDHEISQLASKMRAWFRMTDVEAMDRATGFLTLAYGWGSPPSGTKLEQMIKRDLSKVFEWVPSDARIAFEASEAQRLAEQENFIFRSNSTPRFRGRDTSHKKHNKPRGNRR